MKKAQFNNWIREHYSDRTAKSRMSNCERLEQYEGNLDDHFNKDRGASLLQRLSYSKNDHRNNKNVGNDIPIDGDIYNGTATLRSAVNLYFKYRSGETRESPTITREKNFDWPIWDHPTDDELYELVKLTAKYIKFLNPSIIERIVKDNDKHQVKWAELLAIKGIPSEIYLWRDSPCAFPGVRRYAGSKEIAAFRGHTQLTNDDIEYAVRLDDNDYPKHIWSYISRKDKFQKYGPSNFALAHLADHKAYNNRLFSEFDIHGAKEEIQLFGLFTCPTNTVYIPTSLLRPTEFSPAIQRILIRRSDYLYGGFCNILPPRIKLKPEVDDPWDHEHVEWSDPVGDIENVKLFLEFRNETMKSILA